MLRILLWLTWISISVFLLFYFADVFSYVKNKLLFEKKENQKEITFPTINKYKEEITDVNVFLNKFFNLSNNSLWNIANKEKITFVDEISFLINEPIKITEKTYKLESNNVVKETNVKVFDEYWKIVAFNVVKKNREYKNKFVTIKQVDFLDQLSIVLETDKWFKINIWDKENDITNFIDEELVRKIKDIRNIEQ